jgi:hypothetical protein
VHRLGRVVEVQEGLESGSELLQFHLAQGDDDLAGAFVTAEDLDVPDPLGFIGRWSLLVGVELVARTARSRSRMLAWPPWASWTRAASTSGSGRSSRVMARTAEKDNLPCRKASAMRGRRSNSWATRSFSKAVERAMLVLHTNQVAQRTWPSNAHHPSRSNSTNWCSQRASARSISARCSISH